jgi:hypothetical protein
LAKIVNQISFSGRANTVLVIGDGKDSRTVISSVVAQVSDQHLGKRIRLIGPANFARKASNHIMEVVLVIADNIISALNLPKHNFDISVVNLGATSLNEIGLTISGYSADVSVLLAILSASLQLPISDDIVYTGHIASLDGDIRMVRGLGAKLKAAEKAESIQAFVYPEVGHDNSLEYFTPTEKGKITDALLRAKSAIRIVSVRDIGELVRVVFAEDQVILASLKKGFFKSFSSTASRETVYGRVLEFFADDHEKRFWEALERQMVAGRNDDAKQLLLAFADFHIGRKSYPKKLGSRLFNLIQSLPPETRRRNLDFPVLPLSKCIQLSQLAHESELDDVVVLFKAATGDKTQQLPAVEAQQKREEDTTVDHGNDQLQFILSEIDADALTSLISLPIDNARAAYVVGIVIVESNEEFNDLIASFYLHLLRHTRKLSDAVDMKAGAAEGFALLERAFSKKGGLPAALAEARNATNGGLRYIFDLMTEQFKHEQLEKHINFVLKSELDPLDWDGKVALMGALLASLKAHLPPEIISQPPERYAGHYDNIVRTYVESVDQVKAIFRNI